MRLANKVALVTGGSRSIGRAICLAFAREGAEVAVNYERNEAAAKDVVREIESMGRRAIAVRTDVSDSEQVRAMIEEVVRTFGHLDVLANNAGMLIRGSFLELSEEAWDRVLSVDLKGAFLVGQAAARQMVAQGTGGAIVNTTSIVAFMAQPGLSHYQAAKGGLLALTRGMAVELAPHGIRVNCVSPGVIHTDINAELYRDPAAKAAREAKVPLNRLGRPEDVANAVVYLASDEAAFTTATGILVDGGELAW